MTSLGSVQKTDEENKMDLHKFYEDHGDEFLEFKRVSNPTSSRPDVHAFHLLNVLVPSSEDMISCAEHDQIWLNIEMEELIEVASEEQLIELHRCGVWYDEGAESLSMWV